MWPCGCSLRCVFQVSSCLLPYAVFSESCLALVGKRELVALLSVGLWLVYYVMRCLFFLQVSLISYDL